MRSSNIFSALALLLASACATSGKPKARAPRPDLIAIGCLDTLHAVDAAEAFVMTTVASADTSVKLPPGFADLFVETIRSHFKAPAKLSLSVVMGAEPCDSLGLRCAGGELSIGSTAYVTAYNNRTLSKPAIVDETSTPSVANGLRDALGAISRSQEVPWMGAIDSIPLVVTLATRADADSATRSTAVFKALVPMYDAPFTYAVMPRGGVDARYPVRATIAGVGDTVTIEFTVLPDGTVAPESIAVVEARYSDFVTTVLDALFKTRYHPAHLGDCAVATRIKQRFVFNLAH